jgi:hypothetical protein
VDVGVADAAEADVDADVLRAYAALFAYLSGATFVLQGIYGLSPQE